MKRQNNRILLVTILTVVVFLISELIFFRTSDFKNEYKKILGGITIPEFSGEACVILNDNVPFFREEDYTTQSYEYYSELDVLGRCGYAMGCIGRDLMPTEKRGDIGSVRPTGWHTVRYDCIEDKYLFNRCHLLAYEMTGENANEKNLITGTRYMNATVMLPFEIQVINYVKRTGNHVLYRVTPYFEGDNLLATGLILEAKSMEDGGKAVQFCVFCYNIQPGIEINYKNGESHLINQ